MNKELMKVLKHCITRVDHIERNGTVHSSVEELEFIIKYIYELIQKEKKNNDIKKGVYDE